MAKGRDWNKARMQARIRQNGNDPVKGDEWRSWLQRRKLWKLCRKETRSHTQAQPLGGLIKPNQRAAAATEMATVTYEHMREQYFSVVHDRRRDIAVFRDK